MPEELKSKVQAAAEKSGRSLHAELLHRLDASFSIEPSGSDTVVQALALAVAKAEEDAAAMEIQNVSRIFQGAIVGQAFMELFPALDALGVEFPNKKELDEAYEAAYLLYLDAERTLEAGRFDKAMETAKTAEANLKKAKRVAARTISSRGDAIQEPLDFYQSVINRKPMQVGRKVANNGPSPKRKP
ncbi:hypothetical protein RD110_07905 [Rhodoferax koreense]|uniref:Arc-like DNA binding domain-containing protein n=2 Tax=Rhodoferax koreensis TaxID=1842727 RepID=A0A1P8JTP0_9BURK|nr:hypothetical protein RD110_07905 [Rhodoferax koreense]